MRTIPIILTTFAALSLSMLGARASNGSWCANYGTGHSGIDCSFKSMEQCLATLSGLSGFCAQIRSPARATGEAGPGTYRRLPEVALTEPSASSTNYSSNFSSRPNGRHRHLVMRPQDSGAKKSPARFRPSRSAPMRDWISASVSRLCCMPILRPLVCARAASGHGTAAPPSVAKNFRRPM
jgi:hypothetical protein